MKTFIYPYVSHEQDDSDAETPGLLIVSAKDLSEANSLIKQVLIDKVGEDNFTELEEDEILEDMIVLEDEPSDIYSGYILGKPMEIAYGS